MAHSFGAAIAASILEGEYFMKKIIAVASAAVLGLTLAACAAEEEAPAEEAMEEAEGAMDEAAAEMEAGAEEAGEAAEEAVEGAEEAM